MDGSVHCISRSNLGQTVTEGDRFFQGLAAKVGQGSDLSKSGMTLVGAEPYDKSLPLCPHAVMSNERSRKRTLIGANFKAAVELSHRKIVAKKKEVKVI